MPTLKIKYRTFDGFERAIAAQTAHFSALRPDVGFELSHGGPEEIYAEMVEQGGATDGRYDVMLTLTDWLPDLIRRKGLRSIDTYLASDPPEGWPGGWSDSVLGLQRDAQGAIYGLPYHDGPEIFHYRTDLFGNPAEQVRFQRLLGYPLRPPETWSEFLDVARFFTRPDDGLYGTVVAGLNDGHNNVYDFLIHLWSRGGQLLDERLRPAFDSPAGHEALQFYVDLLTKHNVTPPRALEYDSVAAGVAYAAGEGAMMLNWSGFMAVAQLPPSTIIGKTRSARRRARWSPRQLECLLGDGDLRRQPAARSGLAVPSRDRRPGDGQGHLAGGRHRRTPLDLERPGGARAVPVLRGAGDSASRQRHDARHPRVPSDQRGAQPHDLGCCAGPHGCGRSAARGIGRMRDAAGSLSRLR